MIPSRLDGKNNKQGRVVMGLSCLGCGETTEVGELCPACRAAARRQTRILAVILLALMGSAILALVLTA